MSVIRLNRSLKSRLFNTRSFSNALKNDEEYTATPQYPPILDLSFKKKLERKKEVVYEEIKAVKTVEEKQIKLNMPKYYGFKSYILPEDTIPYDSLSFSQHITKTHLVINNKLPDYYNKIPIDYLVDKVKSDIEEMVLLEFEGYRRLQDSQKDIPKSEVENIIADSVSRQINRLMINKMHKNYSHLLDVQVDLEPRIESSWYVGGMNPPELIKKIRRGQEWMKPYENDPVDRLMVYLGSPSLTVRSQLPLNTVVPFSEAENPDLHVPFFQYDPKVLSVSTGYRHMANVPGFWPGESHRFGLLSYHKRGHILTRERYQDSQDDKEALHTQGILASFGWLSAQANYLGFTTFNDITYPLVTQTIITNGKLWSFYIYQMNTMLLHSKYIKENPKTNICWATEELKLYEDIKDGKVIGLNEDVLKLILKVYANVPESRLGINLTPYLSSEEKVSADYEDDEKREWLEREFKYLVSNRPRHHEVDEIYSWEKIYKIDNKTRFMEKRLRPFELFVNPYNRKLDDRTPIYIPRAQRPNLPRWKGRYKREFFP